MLVQNQFLKVKWHHKNRSWYESKGYIFTKYKEEFSVKVEDLNPTTHDEVSVICDVCGKVIQRSYRRYLRERDEEFGDTCISCKKEKQARTNKEKYGVDWCLQREDFKQKQINTCRDRYGVDYISQDKTFRENVVKSCRDRYGYDYVSQVPQFAEKARLTFYKNGNCPTSQQQLQMYNSLKTIYENCELNYPVGNCSLDCYVEVDGNKIDVEYDGWYWHKNKQEKDKRRNYWLIKQGYKILRYVAYKDIVPSIESLQENINKLIDFDKAIIVIELR